MHSAWQLYDVDVPRRFNVVPGRPASVRKRIVQFGHGPFIPANGRHPGERARARTPSGHKRVNGPTDPPSISTISSSSLTSARKLDDVSNYPTQKPPPFSTKYDVHVLSSRFPPPPLCPSLTLRRRYRV